jgi:HlyD family secretion protein
VSRKKKIIIGVVLLLLIGGGVGGSFYFRGPQTLEVAAEAIRKRDLEALVSASGKIQPKRQVNISANTMGRVTRLAVEEGQRVKQGEFLLEIDPRSLTGQLQRGQASVEAARSSLQQTRTLVEQAKATLELAEQNLKRQQELWKEGLTTRENLDKAENDVNVRRVELRAREQDVRTREQQIRQEEAGLETTRYNLSQIIIQSPMDGLVTRRNIEQGENVVVGTMNNAGTVLLTIADMSVIEAEVEVDETDIPNVALGQRAKVTIDAVEGKTFTGRVTEIGNSPIQAAGAAAATGQRQATNFKVVVTIDEEVPDVRPGFTCTAEITTANRAQAVAVPIQSLTVREMLFDAQNNLVHEPPPTRRRGGPTASVETPVSAAEPPPGHTRKETEGVFVVRDGRAVFVPVTVGVAGERYFEVLSGLKEGDQVITGPFASVRQLADGEQVKIQEAAKRTP